MPSGRRSIESVNDPTDWMEQYHRVHRWYYRLTQYADGRQPGDCGPEDCLDCIYAFYLNCYHLKDWLKKDPNWCESNSRWGYTSSDAIEGWISGNPFLALCADICNRSKHLRLDRRTRTRQSKQIAGRVSETSQWVQWDQPHDTWSGGSAYCVDGGSWGMFSAFVLARSCLDAWDRFLCDSVTLRISALAQRFTAQRVPGYLFGSQSAVQLPEVSYIPGVQRSPREPEVAIRLPSQRDWLVVIRLSVKAADKASDEHLLNTIRKLRKEKASAKLWVVFVVVPVPQPLLRSLTSDGVLVSSSIGVRQIERYL